ncbi:MAG: hypothetical protein DCF27_07515 [Lysobacteraceae bacterium]|nr:MAG: hypothetical protein DCF27_07515 [Xanthomonadaceae bacterium]
MNSDKSPDSADRFLCPFCHGETLRGASHVSPHNSVRYLLHHCRNCLLEHWTPRKVDLTIYTDHGFEAYEDYHSGRRSFPRWAEPLFDQLPRDVESAVDIGCGDGAVLKRLQLTGVSVTGIDLDAESVHVANERCGAGTCSVTTLEPFAIESRTGGRSFDLVTFFEVLEHQTDPLQFLSDIRSLVRPGGWVAGSVPNRNRFLATLDRRFGDGDFPPHHFLWFSPSTLGRMIGLAGFIEAEIVETESVTYVELTAKLKVILSRSIAGEKRLFRSLFYRLMLALAPIAAGILHLGRLRKPSHIFFRFRRPPMSHGISGTASE